MPLGGVLGTRAGMNIGIGAGTGRGKSGLERYGSSLRTGRPMPVGAGPASDGGDDAYRSATQAAQAAGQARAASGASQNPYMPPAPAATEDPMKGVGTLGGGTMGLKPDYTARDLAQKELESIASNPPGWLERQFDGDASYNDKLRAATLRRDWAEKKANEDAMWARAAAEETIPVAGALGEGGVRLAQKYKGGVAVGRPTPMMYEEQFKNEGPLAPKFDPYAGKEWASEEKPVIDPAYARAMAEARTRAAEGETRSARDFGEAQKLQQAAQAAALEREKVGAGLRHRNVMEEIGARGGEQEEVATHKAGLKTEPAPKRIITDSVKDWLETNVEGGFDAWKMLDVAEKNKLLKQAQGADPMQGRKMGPVSGDDGVVERTLKDGTKVRVKKLPNGKWQKVS